MYRRIIFSLIICIFIILLFGCSKYKLPELQLNIQNEIQFKKQFRVSLENKELINWVNDYISLAQKTDEELGDPIFTIYTSSQNYNILERGFETKNTKYLYDQDLSPLFHLLYFEFHSLRKLNLANEDLSNFKLSFNDIGQTNSISMDILNAIKDEFSHSIILRDPVIYFGVQYPSIELIIKDDLTLRWISPSIIRVILNGHIIGDVQLSSKLWDQLEEVYPNYFIRSGLFNFDSITIMYQDTKINIDNLHNRLDNLVRLFDLKDEAITEIIDKADLTLQPIVLLDSLNNQVLLTVYNDDSYEYDGLLYYKRDIYKDLLGFMIVP